MSTAKRYAPATPPLRLLERPSRPAPRPAPPAARPAWWRRWAAALLRPR